MIKKTFCYTVKITFFSLYSIALLASACASQQADAPGEGVVTQSSCPGVLKTYRRPAGVPVIKKFIDKCKEAVAKKKEQAAIAADIARAERKYGQPHN